MDGCENAANPHLTIAASFFGEIQPNLLSKLFPSQCPSLYYITTLVPGQHAWSPMGTVQWPVEPSQAEVSQWQHPLRFLHSGKNPQDHQAEAHLCDDLDHITYFQLQLIFMLRDVAELSFAPSLADLLPWRAKGKKEMYVYSSLFTFFFFTATPVYNL